MGPFLDEAGREVRERYTPDQLELVTDYLAFTRDIQHRHVERLREMPAPRPARTGGRQSQGPRARGAA